MLKISPDKVKWPGFEFTPEEDILLVSGEGQVYLFDPKTGDQKDKDKTILLGAEFSQRPIVDCKLFDSTLVFRNTVN